MALSTIQLATSALVMPHLGCRSEWEATDQPPLKTLGNGMRMLYPVYRFWKKTKNFFRGGGPTALLLQTPGCEWELVEDPFGLLLDELVEQAPEDQAADHEPRDSERGRVFRTRDLQCRGREAMMPQEVNQDAQRTCRCQKDDQPLAHVRIRLSCFPLPFVREWEPAFRTLPARLLVCRSLLAVVRCGGAFVFRSP